MKTSKILEYPYCGQIYHVVDGMGRESDTETLLYEGVMDEHQVTDEEGSTMQTASYIISVPWKDYCTCCGGGVTLPKKGDKIILLRYGEEFELRVDNAEPSQIGGISIYASRADW
jgi:hypothetical protein